ncbi:unnamed protein product [Leptosia nina]|uniref:Secreted protein n=1 Tax=Leptosia nina TaxID=320188 RepID=A0AAV1JT42_9NEOP
MVLLQTRTGIYFSLLHLAALISAAGLRGSGVLGAVRGGAVVAGGRVCRRQRNNAAVSIRPHTVYDRKHANLRSFHETLVLRTFAFFVLCAVLSL